ncbi:hypothetical protein M5K25_025707 [Dendrobium thyrsiflorum]|uniref:Uncharacterized protein n=1 Tax=Dendrobium thyrsiflorum TaxID=117978 RepID=A0ABD0U528_DENTH
MQCRGAQGYSVGALGYTSPGLQKPNRDGSLILAFFCLRYLFLKVQIGHSYDAEQGPQQSTFELMLSAREEEENKKV